MSNEANTPIRAICFIQKNPDITDEQFQSHWKDVHGPKALPLMKKHNVTYFSLTYTTAIPTHLSGTTPLGHKLESWDYDAFTTAEFQSVQDSDAFWKDPEYEAIVKEDAKIMAVGGKMTVVLGKEEVLIGTK